MLKMGRIHCRLMATFVLWVTVLPFAAAAEKAAASFHAALESITADQLDQSVRYLADEKLEGREAGTPGGHAAGEYLAARLEKLKLHPAGSADQGFFQPFGHGLRNVLALLPGSDPELKNQIILVGAHYDHLGHGPAQPDSGKPRPIYPGADDNASGTSGVLQVAQALTLLPEPPKRSVLLAFWDGEEKGLLGSRHWVAHPTALRSRLTAVVNVDMIGGLRDNQLLIIGTRTAYGFRRFISEQNQDSDLQLGFSWAMRPIADHYPFFESGLPVLTFHTGMHETYHQPSDDIHHVDPVGMMRVSRLLFTTVYELANRSTPLRFRMDAGREDNQGRKRFAEAEPSPIRPGDPPLRLGITWRVDDAEPGTVMLTHVVEASPAAVAGLRVGDRVYQINGRDFADDASFAERAKTLPGPLELLIERDGRLQVIVVHLPNEPGALKRAA